MQHKSGKGSAFTKKHGYSALRWSEEFDDLEQARLREIQLKGWSRKKKEALWKGLDDLEGDDSRLERSSRSNNKDDTTGFKISLVAHDIRSTHNVGAFFRTCDGLGVKEIIFSGYTPHPTFEGDSRLPHFADKITRQIHKTALGAETAVDFMRFETLEDTLEYLKSEGTILVALEQAVNSVTPEECAEIVSSEYPGKSVALILGNEIHGVKDDILAQMDIIMEIPMHGMKESFNVSVAAGIALYWLTKIL